MMTFSLPIVVEGNEHTCGLIDQQWIIDRISVETWNKYRGLYYNIYKKKHQREYEQSSWWDQMWFSELQTYSEFVNEKYSTLLPGELDINFALRIFFNWASFWKVDLNSIGENVLLNRVRTAIVFLGIYYPKSKNVWKRIQDVVSEISDYEPVFGLRLHPYLIAQELIQDIDSFDEDIRNHLNECALYINDPNNTELIPLILEEDKPPWLVEAESLLTTTETPNLYQEHEVTGQSTDADGSLQVVIASVGVDDCHFRSFNAAGISAQDRYQVEYSNGDNAVLEDSQVVLSVDNSVGRFNNVLTISGLTPSQNNVTVTVSVEVEVDNAVIMNWANNLGIWYDYDSTPWCGLFVAHCTHTGAPNVPHFTNVLRARNWEQYGVEADLQTPPYGSICVLWRKSTTSGYGHVFIVTSRNDDDIIGIGGNQGDQVTTATFSRDRLVAIRVPTGYRGVPAPVEASGTLSENEQ